MESADRDVRGPSVAVIGMPRSGTSLTTRILGLLGVDLGPDEGMLPADAGNPKGYWEHNAINRLNDEVLRTFGGTFHSPPVLPTGWEDDERLDALRERARSLIDDNFRRTGAWGWKDPRNSFTQPFWRPLVPDMRFVVCVRSPEEVVRSWRRRDADFIELSREKLLKNWVRYNAAAIQSTLGARRTIVFYEDYFVDPARQVAGLAALLELEPEPEQIQAALRFVDSDLWRERADDVPPELPDEVRAVWDALVLLAGRDGAPSQERLRTSLTTLLAMTERWPTQVVLGESVEDAQRERAHSEAEMWRTKEALDYWKSEAASVAEQLEQHRQWLAAMNRSVSWRATAPLRAAARAARGRTRGD